MCGAVSFEAYGFIGCAPRIMNVPNDATRMTLLYYLWVQRGRREKIGQMSIVEHNTGQGSKSRRERPEN